MSYILEAIKKADLKRKIGNVPDIHSDHDVHLSEPNHRAIWPYVLAIALFFNAGLIAWWLQPWGDTTTEKGPPSPLPSHIEELANKPQPADLDPTNISLPIPLDNALPPIMAGTPTPDGPLDQGDPILPQVSPANIIPTPPPAADTTSKPKPLADPKLPAEEAIQATTPATLSERLGAVTHSLSQKTAAEKVPQSNTHKPLPTPAVLPASNNKPIAIISDDNTASDLSAITDPKLPPQGGGQATPPATLSERLGAVTHSLAHKTVAEKAPQSNINKPVLTDAGLPASNDKPVLLTPNGDKDLEGTILESQVTIQTQLDDNETTENELDDSAEPETIAELGRPVFDIKKVPLLYQLPESVQKDIPEIKISFHSYRYRPSSRLVRINGRIMREGQEITNNLILEKIIPSGVVLLFENKRFRVGL